MYIRLTILPSLFLLLCVFLALVESEGGDHDFTVTGMAGTFWTFKNGWIPAERICLQKGDIVRFDGGVLSKGPDERIATLQPFARCAIMFEYSCENIHLSSQTEQNDNYYLMKLSLNKELYGICTNSVGMLRKMCATDESASVKSLSIQFSLSDNDAQLLMQFRNLIYLNVKDYATNDAKSIIRDSFKLRLVLHNGSMVLPFDNSVLSAEKMGLKFASLKVDTVEDVKNLTSVIYNLHTCYIEWNAEPFSETCKLSIPVGVKNITIVMPRTNNLESCIGYVACLCSSVAFLGIVIREPILFEQQLWTFDCDKVKMLKGISLEYSPQDPQIFCMASGLRFSFKNEMNCNSEYIDLRGLRISPSNMALPKVETLFCENILADMYSKDNMGFPLLKSIYCEGARRDCQSILRRRILKMISGGDLIFEKAETVVIPRGCPTTLAGKDYSNLMQAKEIQLQDQYKPVWMLGHDVRDSVTLPAKPFVVAFGDRATQGSDLPKELDLTIASPTRLELSGDCHYTGRLYYDNPYK